jgi:hypothetical protein
MDNRRVTTDRTDHVVDLIDRAVGKAARAATCRCERHADHPCERAITQEDLRCDVCRASGCTEITIGRNTSYHAHVTFGIDVGRFDVGPIVTRVVLK